MIGKGDISLSEFSKISKYFNEIFFSGNISDCIYHPKFLEILEICENNNNIVTIETNGSGKKLSWWKEAFKYERVKWKFALDGLPSASHLYRINQDGKQVFEVMKLGAKLKRKIFWKHIIFSYNQYDIEEVKELAEKYNMRLILILSSRWSGDNDLYKPNEGLYLEF